MTSCFAGAGSVAIDLALHHPELVRDLILVDAQAHLLPAAGPEPPRRARELRGGRAGLQAYIDGAAMEGNPRFMKALGVKVLHPPPPPSSY